MKRIYLFSGLLLLLMLSCESPTAIQQQEEEIGLLEVQSAKRPGETAGNNLSFPVIWSEGVEKILPGTPGMDPILTGGWWYWWGTEGTDPNITPLSCAPDPDNEALCDDGLPGQTTGDAPGEGWVKAYLQKDARNTWQASAFDAAGPLDVHWIDWGDNLESVDWYTRSQVRTEVVLFQDLATPMLEYEMRHVSGWGITEVHGLAATQASVPMLGPGDQATVFSPCARLTIQKLLVDREDMPAGALEWVPGEGWTETNPLGQELVNPPIFNGAVYEAQDGKGYYNAEINVKGRIIYGYTWNVRKLNDKIVNGGEPAGDYRTTFSFDQSCDTAELNTFFTQGITQIITPEEELFVPGTEASDGGGGVPVLDFGNNLTYIDVRILERSGGRR